MTGPSQAFQLGDVVEIIGPALGGIHAHVGEKGKLSDIDRGGYLVSGLWYPASSLRLVEPELKIGDWVQVLDQPTGLHGEPTGQIVQIDRFHDEDGRPHASGWYYYASGLRKLTPEEALCHLTKRPGFTAEQRLDSLEEYTKESDARLAAIESRQNRQTEVSDILAQRLAEQKMRQDAIEHKQLCQAIDIKGLQLRLAPLEAGQKGVDGEKRIRSGLKDRRLFVLRQIATGMQELCEGRGLLEMGVGKFWLAELVKVEKQLAEGQ